MNYKILITDLDGTFLDNHSAIPEKNVEALKVLRDENIKFVIGSGRSFQSLDYLLNSLGSEHTGEYRIAFNGALVYETKTLKQLYKSLLQRDIMLHILEKLQNFDLEIIIYDCNGKLFSTTESPYLKNYIKMSHIPYRIIKNFNEIEGDIFKIVLIGDNNDLKDIYNYIYPHVDGIANVFFTCKTLLEFTNLKATKGEAVQFLANHLNIPISQVITMGDNYNDISMIETAGLGIAVANAEEDVKQIADYVTEISNHEGALSEIVNKFILKR